MVAKKKSPKSAPADDKPEKEEAGQAAEEKWLIVPSNPIDGGNDIGVGIRIKPVMIFGPADDGDTPPTAAKIELKWNDKSIAAIDLPKAALDMIKGQAIQISTRIKIAAKPKEVVEGALNAVLTVVPPRKHPIPPQTAKLKITGNENPSMNNGQMVLQVQPVKSTLKGSDMILARSLAPSPQLKENRLREISGALSSLPGGSPTTFITMTVAAPQLLSDDVFLAFNFTPIRPGTLEVSWSYDDGKGGTQRLSATAFLPTQTNS
jgi:hypothetical protein